MNIILLKLYKWLTNKLYDEHLMSNKQYEQATIRQMYMLDRISDERRNKR